MGWRKEHDGRTWVVEGNKRISVMTARSLWVRWKREGNDSAEFTAAVCRLMRTYTEGDSECDTGYKDVNAWATPWNISCALKHCFRLDKMLFSNSLNADPAFVEYCTPSPADRRFGAEIDGFAALERDVQNALHHKAVRP